MSATARNKQRRHLEPPDGPSCLAPRPFPLVWPLVGFKRSTINIHQKDLGRAPANIDDRVAHVGTIAGRVAGFQIFCVTSGLDAHAAFLDGEELSSALEVRRTSQRASGL